MGPEDAAIWSIFIANNPSVFSSVFYDVRIGKGVTTGIPATDPIAADFQQLTQKRIDVVAQGKNTLWIIEIKPRASVIAIGQATAYLELFSETYNIHTAIQAAVITDMPDTDILNVANTLGVTILYALTNNIKQLGN